ncbi:MAG: hypothetical protein ABID35_01335 [Candidatus Margulisiibacteriota bacterium]
MYLKTKKMIVVLFLIFVSLLLVSCSASKEKIEVQTADDDIEIVEEQVSTLEADPRETVFTYNNQPEKVFLKEALLKLNSEPLLLTSGYVRLVGVVSGGKPLALIEVGGRGVCLALGDEVGGYCLVEIKKNGIRLLRKSEG